VSFIFDLLINIK